MSALHERLLVATEPGQLLAMRRTLRAVVELHAPRQPFEGARVTCVCGEDGYMAQDGAPWPCSTVQAIARELGIEVTGRD